MVRPGIAFVLLDGEDQPKMLKLMNLQIDAADIEKIEFDNECTISLDLHAEVHKLQHLWVILILQQHKRNAWPDHCWGRCCNDNASRVVELGSITSQQDNGDSSAWWRCWDEVVLLHGVKESSSLFVLLFCG